jgi:two-component system cell cycle sensor histidine kinase/response regulator CckA
MPPRDIVTGPGAAAGPVDGPEPEPPSAAAQADKMRAVGQLAGGIAHDFNNLLTAIAGFCDILLLRHGPGDPSRAELQAIRQSAEHGIDLVRQLLAFSRRQRLRTEVLDLRAVIDGLGLILARTLGDGIELVVEHAPGLWPVEADRGQLERVVLNLAINARDAMPAGGTLTVATANRPLPRPMRRGPVTVPAGDYVGLVVSDTGTGIPDSIIGRVFDPFFTTKPPGSGTGLGLSTVYGIVKQSGGFVFVDSPPGQGAAFSILLPVRRSVSLPSRASGARRKAAESSAARPGGRPATVLLVEDQDAVRRFAGRALRGAGYAVIEADGGEAALAVIDREGPALDLVVTDLSMPRVDGLAVIRHARAAKPGIAVLCVSGFTEDAFDVPLELGPGVRFLAKPFGLDQLIRTVSSVLERNAG